MMSQAPEFETAMIATFYSYKGGTGRSMALANIACLLGRNSQEAGTVLAIDWDLEAPGLHRYFPKSSEEETKGERAGVIDYFWDLARLLDEGRYEEFTSEEGWIRLEEALPLSNYIIRDVAKGVDLMKAGRLGTAYRNLVLSFNWEAFFRRYHRIFSAFREQLASRYRWCLIDSRTGISDISGVCTMVMPEKLVAVFTPNVQSIGGLLDIIAEAVKYRCGSDDPRPLSVFPLPSRTITVEPRLMQESRAYYIGEFEKCLREAYALESIDLAGYFDEVEIPHENFYGFRERVAVRDDPFARSALSINRAYQRFYERLVKLDCAWEPLPIGAEPATVVASRDSGLTVYISSTVTDLKAHRTAARDAAINAGLLPIMMEQLAANGAALQECLRRVSAADVVVAIVAHRYGWVPPDQPAADRKSLTWLECEHAEREGKLLLGFLIDNDCDWPVQLRESYRVTAAIEDGTFAPGLADEVQRNVSKLGDFKRWLGRNLCTTFSTPDDLRVKIESALLELFGAAAPTKGDPGRYLESLRNETAFIDIRGLQVGTGRAYRFPIEDLYFPLTTAAGPGVREPVPIEDAIKHPRLVITGDPGAGKTTFLRHIAFGMCDDLMRGGTGRFPILISIAELAEHVRAYRRRSEGPTGAASPGWLPHWLAARSAEFAWGLDAQFFERKLKDGEAALLLDGLDEAPLRTERESMARLLENATRAYEKCTFLVTTRPLAYQAESVLDDFQTANIAPLEPQAIDTFLERWCGVLFSENPASFASHLAELSGALRTRAEIHRMARNPVMLTALAVVHWNERRLPERRADLYESILTWLARSREQRPDRPTAERCLILLQHLALAMQNAPKGRAVQVAKRWAADALAPHFREVPEPSRLSRAFAFLEQEEIDSGIIASRASDISFRHLTFQEYLAAKAVAGMADTAQQEILLGGDAIYKPEWREVVLLLGSILYQQGLEKADSLASAILEKLGERPSLAEQARCAGLLGAMVRDLRPFNYQPADPGYQRAMGAVLGIFDADKAHAIEFRIRLEAAEALGDAGDPRLRQDNWVMIEGGGSARRRPFQIARYPVTVEEYRRFVEDEGYQTERWWRSGGFAQFKPQFWNQQVQYGNRPVTGVSWYEAAAYCAWAGVRLPSEAEWERAARGLEGREYPWGNQEPDEQRANFDMNVGHPTPVGLYPAGATPEGVVDMAGNVWEWAEDWYERDKLRALRGGSYLDASSNQRAAYRFRFEPGRWGVGIGFRCARDIVP
jgi:hypothetical protein